MIIILDAMRGVEPPDQLTENGAPNGVAIALVLVVGLVLLAHPLYLYPHLGQTPYSVYVSGTQTVSPPDEEVIAYSALPPDAQRAFDAARQEEVHRLWTGENDEAINTLGQFEYIHVDGTYYQYQIGHIDRLTHAMPVRGLLTTLGAILVVLGLLIYRNQQWRPLTPLRSLWFPVGTTIAISGTQLYDVVLLGVSEALPLPNNITALLPLLVLFFTVGSLSRIQGKKVLLWAVGLGAALLVLYSVYIHFVLSPPLGDTSPAVATARFALFFGLVFAVAAAPWFGLGYKLTIADASADTSPIEG